MSKEKAAGVPIGTIGGLAIAGGAVVGIVYLGYKYFVEPGSLILAQYRFYLEDVYKETKKFLEDNAKLSPPIYGLTAGQEAMLQAKEKAAEELRKKAEEELDKRGFDVNTWVAEAIAGILIVYGIVTVVPKLLEQLRLWRQKPESQSIQSSHGHTHLLYEIVMNEMSLSGQLNIASGFQLTIQSYYTTFTESAITQQIAFYNSLLPSLIPGTLEYIATVSLLNYLSFEMSAAGIMGTLWSFWMI